MFDLPAPDADLTQGDIIDACPITAWTKVSGSDAWQLEQSKERVLVLTQSCDLANGKATRV